MRAAGYTLDLHDGDDLPNDPDGHGTACIGMIAAEGNNSQTMIGVAFDCSIVTVKINDGGTHQVFYSKLGGVKKADQFLKMMLRLSGLKDGSAK